MRTRLVFLSFLVSLFAINAFALNDGIPKLTVVNPVVDFGRVNQGKKLDLEFHLRNDGTAPLDLKRVYPACGCTVASSLPTKPLEPGQDFDLKVTFDTSGFYGFKSKVLRVYSNDPQKASTLLTLKGFVEEVAKVTPERISFGDVEQGTAREATFKVVQNDTSVRIKEIVARPEGLEVESAENRDGSWNGTVRLTKAVPVGVFRGSVLIKTTSKTRPVIALPIFARVLSDLRATPSTVSFGLLEGPLEGAVGESVTVENTAESPLTELAAEIDIRDAEVHTKQLSGGKSYSITVTLPSGMVGNLKGKLKIVGTRASGETREIAVPVFGIITRKGP